MARIAREWSATDKRVSAYFNQLKTDKDMTYRAMSEKSGIVFTRIQKILEQSGGVPTLDEFIDLCICFDISPATTLKTVLDSAEGLEEEQRSQSPVESPEPVINDDDVPLTADGEVDYTELADNIAAHPDLYNLAANQDDNKELESQTPRD